MLFFFFVAHIALSAFLSCTFERCMILGIPINLAGDAVNFDESSL